MNAGTSLALLLLFHCASRARFSEVRMYTRRTTAVGIASIAILSISCTAIGVVQNAPPVPFEPDRVQTETQVVIVARGKYCHYSFGVNNVDPDEFKCPEGHLSEEMFLPASLWAKNPGRKFAWQFGSSLPSSAVDATRQVLRVPENALFEFPPKPRTNKSALGYDVGSMDFKSIAEWESFRAQKHKNTLFIYVSEQIEDHWSMYVAMFSLGIIPGGDSVKADVYALYYDARGQERRIEPRTQASLSRWFHLLFYPWGDIQMVASARPKMLRFALADISDQVGEK